MIPTPRNIFVFFIFNDTATTEIYTLSLHDALPIYGACPRKRRQNQRRSNRHWIAARGRQSHWSSCTIKRRFEHRISRAHHIRLDRKSTRLNSSHSSISYAVFCLKKKKTKKTDPNEL